MAADPPPPFDEITPPITSQRPAAPQPPRLPTSAPPPVIAAPPPLALPPALVPAVYDESVDPGNRHEFVDAFYLDERNTRLAKTAHPMKSYYNHFTVFTGPESYATARVGTARQAFTNPLRDPWAATELLQRFRDIPNAKDLSATVEKIFNEARTYHIYVPPAVKLAYDAAVKKKATPPKARVAVFYGVHSEINVFGLRTFFAASPDSVLVTVPGVESHWNGAAWGLGLGSNTIAVLLEAAGVKGMEFAVEVMAGYSTGYRGLNETIINKLIDLSTLKRVSYLDAFYNHDDFPLSPPRHAFHKKNTAWAVHTALTASPAAEVFIYAYTTGGVPRKTGKGKDPKGPFKELQAAFGARIRLIDLEFAQGKVPALADQLEKVCLARLMQAGSGNYYEERWLPADITALIKLLPFRGEFGVLGRSGFTNLYDWVGKQPQKDALARFPRDLAVKVVAYYNLLGGWTDDHWYNLRHVDFVQEIGRECLLP
jgi:hypothetical protein